MFLSVRIHCAPACYPSARFVSKARFILKVGYRGQKNISFEKLCGINRHPNQWRGECPPQSNLAPPSCNKVWIIILESCLCELEAARPSARGRRRNSVLLLPGYGNGFDSHCDAGWKECRSRTSGARGLHWNSRSLGLSLQSESSSDPRGRKSGFECSAVFLVEANGIRGKLIADYSSFEIVSFLSASIVTSTCAPSLTATSLPLSSFRVLGTRISR